MDLFFFNTNYLNLNLGPTTLHSQELKFAEANGCIDCVSQAYQMYPHLSWIEFVSAFGESKTIRSSWDIGSKILAGEMEQPFNVRGSIDEMSEIGVMLEKKFIALTSDECMALFKLPPESLEGAKSVSVINEENELVTFWLFADDSAYRVATFFSKHKVLHRNHLLEKQKMLRQEQPAERYACLCKDDVASRKGFNVMTLSAAQAKAESLIEARMKQEELQEQTGAKPSEVEHVESDLAGMMAPIARLQLTSQATGTEKTKQPKKKAVPKTPTKKRKGGPGGVGGGGRKPRAASPTPSLAPASMKDGAGGSQLGVEDDELAVAIQSKLKCDPKSVMSMNVQRALQGEQLGRSVVGVSCFCRIVLAVWFGYGVGDSEILAHTNSSKMSVAAGEGRSIFWISFGCGY